MVKKKILIADAEPSVRKSVKKTFSSDYSVLEAKDGAEAVDMANKEKPDLILMEITLPKIDGNTACYMIKNNRATKSISVLVFTGVDYELNRKLSQSLGAEAYITKPVRLKELLKVVDKCLEKEEKSTNNSNKSSLK